MSTGTRARNTVLGLFIGRNAALPPATGVSEDLFSITGLVLLTSFYGYVTAALPAASIDFDIGLDPDGGGSNVALATLLAVDGFGVGTWLAMNVSAAGALTAGTDVVYNVPLTYPTALAAGDIFLNVGGGGAIGTTARVKWGLTYLPLDADGAVVAV